MVEQAVENQTNENPMGTPGNETQEKTYSQEDLDAYLNAQKEEIEATAKSVAWEKYQGIQKTLSEKDQIIKGFQAGKTQPQTPSTLQQGMLELLKAQARESGDEAQIARIATLEQAVTREASNLQYQGEVKKYQDEHETHRGELDRKIKEAGFDPNDDMFLDVTEALENAYDHRNYGLVDRKLERILKTNPKQKESKPEVETEEKMRERIERDVLEKHGLLKPEKVSPSGSGKASYTLAEFRARETEIRNLPSSERAEARQELKEAYTEGRVK